MENLLTLDTPVLFSFPKDNKFSCEAIAPLPTAIAALCAPDT